MSGGRGVGGGTKGSEMGLSGFNFIHRCRIFCGFFYGGGVTFSSKLNKCSHDLQHTYSAHKLMPSKCQQYPHKA